MRSAGEFRDVAAEFRVQMAALGQKDLEVAAVHLYEVDEDTFETWGALHLPDGTLMATDGHFPKKGYAVIEEALARYASDETDYVVVNEGDKARGFFEMLRDWAPEMHESLQKIATGRDSGEMVAYWSFADFTGGSLLMVTYQPADQESRHLLRRCADVIDLAYRRFLDLRASEKRAREIAIDLALERVRARSMAMRESAELSDIVRLVFAQMEVLGLERDTIETVGFHIFEGNGPEGHSWFSSPHGDTIHSYDITYGGNGPTRNMLEAWRAGTPLHLELLEGQILPDHLAYLAQQSGKPFERFHEDAGVDMPPRSLNYCANFDRGFLGLVTRERQEAFEPVLVRFAQVFEQAYRRFLDVRSAEIAAREAQIAAALERVRARATAMRTSEGLLGVMMHIHREFSGLGFPCGAFWNSRYLPTHYEKAVTGMDGTQVTAVMELPRDFSMIPELAAWERGTERLGVFKFGADASVEYLNHMINKGRFLEIVPGALTEELLREMNGWTFIQARTTHGELGYNLWGETEPSEEAKDTLLRFAAVFDLAFRRFVDLREAEAQARDAQISLALERVRARAMAMRKSNELREVSQTITEQLVELGLKIHHGYVFIFEEENDEVDLHVTKSIHHPIERIRERSIEIRMPRAGVENIFPDSSFLFNETPETPWVVTAITPEIYPGWAAVLAPYFEAMGYTAEEYESHLDNGFVQVDASMGNGVIGMGGTEEFTDEDCRILSQFAGEFRLAFTRFKDIQSAEAQARQSRIEAAMERVRGRAMAMQSPDDISDVAILLFEELSGLGIEPLRSGVSIAQEDDKTYEFWAATRSEDGAFARVVGHESVNVHRIIRQAYDGYANGEAYRTAVLEGEDLVDYYRAVFDTMPLPDWQERMRTGAESRESFSTFPFSDGWLYVFFRDDITDAQVNVFERFARVFDLAYKRFHDLTKAEADYQALLAEKARTEEALTTLRSTQKQLIEQEKLASLGSLTAGIAHEIKNPLNFVNNFAEVSEELAEELAEAVESGDSGEAKALLQDLVENAAQIAKHGKRADSIVKSMMQHARGGEATREVIKVNAFVDEYATLAWHGKRAQDHGFQADIIRDLADDAGAVEALPQELGRVLVNLLGNAFDALKGEEDGRVTVSTRREDGRVVIKITDNGPGIAEEIRDRIFEPFFTTKATGEGTGLGLSLSYDIVTKGHGGTMTVGRGPEGGAEFTIRIPVTNGHS